MRKTLIVTQSEFGTLIRSKAFVISVVVMPIIMAGSIRLVQATLDSDTKDRTFAIIDYTGVLGAPLKALAERRNETANGPAGARVGPRFLPVELPVQGGDAETLRLEVSDRVRRKELFAFVEIPAGILDPDSGAEILYYSDQPSYTGLRDWLRVSTNGLILNERFKASSLDHGHVARLTRPAPIENLGLLARDEDGRVRPAEKVDAVRTFGVPAVMMLLMYVTIMASAPQLLNSVIEEKMSRISEVLIGSVTPFQLMMGKLAGSVGVSMVLSMVYFAGALGVATYYGYADAVTPVMFGWFAVFMIMGVLIFGAIFVAIGAACTDLKDSQNMMAPVMLLVMIPIFAWAAILRAPDSSMAVTLSMIPTASPFLMLLRIALRPGPPAWQIAMCVALTAATTVAAVWAAGKIFRTGLLMQGKSATLAEMVRWVRAS